jgi:hypothetical protein
MVSEYEPVKKFIVDMCPKPSEAPTEVEVPIQEGEVPIKRFFFGKHLINMIIHFQFINK